MKTINLLPKEKQKEFRFGKVYRSSWLLVGLVVTSFALVGAFQFGSRMYIERETAKLYSETERIKAVTDKQENAELKKRIQELNSRVNDFNTLADSSPRWSKVLRAFARLVPQRVFIQSFTMDIAKREAQITGYAPERELVIQLYNNISNDTRNFTNIDYPLENVSKPTNVQFHFTFTIEEGVLK